MDISAEGNKLIIISYNIFIELSGWVWQSDIKNIITNDPTRAHTYFGHNLLVQEQFDRLLILGGVKYYPSRQLAVDGYKLTAMQLAGLNI